MNYLLKEIDKKLSFQPEVLLKDKVKNFTGKTDYIIGEQGKKSNV